MTSENRPRVMVVFGTRPESIKLVPVIRELQRHDGVLDTIVISTGQHREMLQQIIAPFGVSVDHDMELMEPGQTLYQVSSGAMLAFQSVLRERRPNLLMVQGDTTTAFVAALASYYAGIPVAHVEAGLRSDQKRAPFPEEINRRLISVIADLNFAPTHGNRQNLLRENVPPASIFVTGNTAIDVLLAALQLQPSKERLRPFEGRRLVLVTLHRRESFGETAREILHAVQKFATATPDATVLFPVHLNPNIKGPAKEILGNVPNVILTEPLEYVDFIHAMSRAELILTDSGGIQEEAPTLGVRVLVLREVTERPEGLETGLIEVVGTRGSTIVERAVTLFNSGGGHQKCPNPYGDGKASARIVKQVLCFLDLADKGLYNEIGEFQKAGIALSSRRNQ